MFKCEKCGATQEMSGIHCEQEMKEVVVDAPVQETPVVEEPASGEVAA